MTENIKKLAGGMLLLACALTLNSCEDKTPSIEPSINYPAQASVTKRDAMADIDGVKVYNGGYGSAISSVDNQIFYIMTDRGPNIDGTESDVKIFSNPEFTPQIGKFRLSGETLELMSVIYMKNASSQKITGLPNPIGVGGTGERALDTKGNVLHNDAYGLDPEGLVAMKDGSFWVSDEYGPHLVHFDANGKEIDRINPFNNKMPQVFKKRRSNRGMEGLTITPDGKYLVGIMQSPLYNPDSKVKKTAAICRILFYELATGKCREYLYALDNTNMANSEIAAITDNTFLVLERDGNLPGQDTCDKKIYKINVSDATDITTADAAGKLIGGKTIEQCTTQEIAAAGIKVVTKELAFDIMSIPHYPHDKPEGIVILNNNLIGIINDDDFGIGGVGAYQGKVMPWLNNTVDKNIMYFVKPVRPLK